MITFLKLNRNIFRIQMTIFILLILSLLELSDKDNQTI